MAEKQSRNTIFALALLLVLGIALTWGWSERRLGNARAEQEREAAELRQSAEAWASSLAASEAEAAFRAFAAGIGPALLGGRRDSVDLAVGSLLELPGVEFVHVLRPDGTVVASSDRKLQTTGRAAADAQWALGADRLVRREGQGGTVELAAPVAGASGPEAVLWMGYRAERVREAARPEPLRGPAEG